MTEYTVPTPPHDKFTGEIVIRETADFPFERVFLFLQGALLGKDGGLRKMTPRTCLDVRVGSR